MNIGQFCIGSIIVIITIILLLFLVRVLLIKVNKRKIKTLIAKRDVDGLLGFLDRDRYRKSVLRKSVLDGLGEIGDTRAIGPLVRYLYLDEAREALVKICDVNTVSPVIDKLKDDTWGKDAAQVLEKIGWQPGNDESAAYYWIWKGSWKDCARLGTVSVDPLVKYLHSKTDLIGNRDGNIELLHTLNRTRSREMTEIASIIETLGEIGDVRAVKPLLSILKNRDATASTILKAQTPVGLDSKTFISAVFSRDPSLRIEALNVIESGRKSFDEQREKFVQSIAAHGAGEKINKPTLSQQWSDLTAMETGFEVLILSIELAWALEKLVDSSVIPVLIDTLKIEVKHKPSFVHLVVAWLLMLSKDANAVDPLIEAIQKDKYLVILSISLFPSRLQDAPERDKNWERFFDARLELLGNSELYPIEGAPS